MASFELDMSEVDVFATDLENVPFELSRHAIPVLKRFAQDVKNAQQEDFEASTNKGFRSLRNSVHYDDIIDGADGYETEVGVDKGKPGSLANLAVFGSYKGGGTHMHPTFHATEALPAFENALADLAEELIL